MTSEQTVVILKDAEAEMTIRGLCEEYEIGDETLAVERPSRAGWKSRKPGGIGHGKMRIGGPSMWLPRSARVVAQPKVAEPTGERLWGVRVGEDAGLRARGKAVLNGGLSKASAQRRRNGSS